MIKLQSVLLVLALGSIAIDCEKPEVLEKFLPNTTNVSTTVKRSTVRLDFREQKPGTEARLQVERQVQQNLLKQQTELKQSGNQTAIAKTEAALKRSDAAIAMLFKPATITEKNLIDARVEATDSSNNSAIRLKFDDAGSKAFTVLTKKLAGTGRSVGIFLNDRLINAPVIAVEFAPTGITGGAVSITGGFSAEEASKVAAQLRGEAPSPDPTQPAKK